VVGDGAGSDREQPGRKARPERGDHPRDRRGRQPHENGPGLRRAERVGERARAQRPGDAEQARELREHDQDRDAGHQPGQHGVRHELHQAAEPRHTEGELDHARGADAGGREEQDGGDVGRAAAREPRVGRERSDEGGQDQARGSARAGTRDRHAADQRGRHPAEDGRGERGADAALEVRRAERSEDEHREGEHQREIDDEDREPAPDVAGEKTRARRVRRGRVGDRLVLGDRAHLRSMHCHEGGEALARSHRGGRAARRYPRHPAGGPARH
jgi:hypothetical protein